MPNSVQKKLSNMFSRVSLSDKGNSATKVPVKGISKRLSSPVASKENGVPVGVVMGGGDQEAMLTFIEEQGNQISQLKEHIASLEAKLLASPPGYSVKPAALLFSPIRGAHDLSEMKSPKSELKSPKKCISVSQASFVPQGSNSPLNVIVSPARNSRAFIPVSAAATESPPMTAVHVMHYSQMSFDSTFSTANGSVAAAKGAIPFQEFVDSCLSENVMSPTARPLLASYVCGDASAIQEQGCGEEGSDTKAFAAVEDVGLKVVSPQAAAIEQQKPMGEWMCQVVAFSSQKYWLHSVTAAIEIFEQIPHEAEFQVDAVLFVSNIVHREPEAAATRLESSSSGSPTASSTEQQAVAATAHLCQHASAINAEFDTQATEHVSGFKASATRQENLVSPCAASMFHASPSLDAAAATHTHVQSRVSPGFSVVSPIMGAACSNQASGNESAEEHNHIVINGLVFSGMAKLPAQALDMLKRSRADFQLVNGVAWVPDCFADSCMLCEEEFSFFFRRHHCRSCGIVICSNCSEWNKEKRCCTECMTASQTPSKQNRESRQVYYA